MMTAELGMLCETLEVGHVFWECLITEDTLFLLTSLFFFSLKLSIHACSVRNSPPLLPPLMSHIRSR